MMDGYGGAGWGLAIAMCVVMVALLVAGAAWLVTTTRSGRTPELPEPDPRRVLDSRLARGEISEEEYLGARSALDT